MAAGYQTFVCEHLVAVPGASFGFRTTPMSRTGGPMPGAPHATFFFLEQGEWNDKNESKLKIKLLCHHCYEMLRSHAQTASPTR